MINRKREVIVVMGPGRSGTSVLTRVLIALGMAQSGKYNEPSEQNPEGNYEDSEIFSIHSELFSLIQSSPYESTPSDLFGFEGVDEIIRKLRMIVDRNVSSSKNNWGFKDPRTASVLPLWSRVFNPLKIVPKYILAVRDPSSVVTSFNRQYNDPVDLGELVWLMRICDAIYNTGGDCFIVHYENLLNSNVRKVIRELAGFSGLSAPERNIDLDNLIAENIKKSLNRSVYTQYQVKNPYVLKLYEALSRCDGADFDRDSLMQVVVECKQAIQLCSPWVEKYKKENTNVLMQFKKSSEELSALKVSAQDLYDKNQILISENSKLNLGSSRLDEQLEALKSDNEKLVEHASRQSHKIDECHVLVTNAKVESSVFKKKVHERQRELVGLNVLRVKNENKDKRAERLEIRISTLRVKNENKDKRVERLQNRISTLRVENENKDKRVERLENRISTLRTKNENKEQRTVRKDKAIFALQTSPSIRIGNTFIQAVSQPGRKTIFFPYYFLKALLEAVFVRKHVE